MLQRFSKNSFKVLLCLVLLFSFMFVDPKNKIEKAYAVLPLAPLLVGALSSVVLDKAVETGIGFVDEKAAKSTSKNIATKIIDKYGDKLKKYPPTKKGLKNLLLNFSPFIIAEVMDELGDLADDVKKNGTSSGDDDLGLPPSKVLIGTATGGAKEISVYADYADFGSQYYKYKNVIKIQDIKTTKEPYLTFNFCFFDVCKFNFISIGTAAYAVFDIGISVDRVSYIVYGYKEDGSVTTYKNSDITFASVLTQKDSHDKNYVTLNKNNVVYNNVIYNNQSTINRYDMDSLSADQSMNIDWKGIYDNKNYELELDFSDFPDLKQQFDALEIDAEVNFEESGWSSFWDFVSGMLDVKTPNYNNNPINVDTGLSDQQLELLQQQVVIVGGTLPDEGNNEGSSGENGFVCTKDGQIIPCKDVEKIDGSLIAYLKNAYEYATNFVKTSVDGLKSLATGAVELTKLYGVFFGWLPKEIVVLMTSGLGIMLGLRIFRK